MASSSYPAWYSLPEQDPYTGEYIDVFAALVAAALTQDPAALLNHLEVALVQQFGSSTT